MRALIILFSLFELAFSPASFATPGYCYPQASLASAQTLYQSMPHLNTVPDRIAYFSQLFLGKPYALTALGEGPQGEFDQAPLYRFDAFDCQTYVETVLALALSHSAESFKQRLQIIRYHSGHIAFINRHHFVAPDWNADNQQQHILQDITRQIHDSQLRSVACYAHAEIDVSNWYQHFDGLKIRLCHASKKRAQHALQVLKQRGLQLPKKVSTLAYIPLSTLFDAKGRPNLSLFQQIPNGAIIEIVRPNWDLYQAIGTHLNVSHMGFAIREQGVLYYYQALASAGFVIKPPLIDYLKSIVGQSSIKGINIQVVSIHHNSKRRFQGVE